MTPPRNRPSPARGFDGPDADAAEEFLATVRETPLVQAAGRSAWNPEDPDDGAVVFVRSSALPEEYVDLKIPGAAWLASDRQARLVEALQQREYATAAELAAAAAAVSKEHVRTTLKRLVAAAAELVECREEAGEHGAHLYRALAGLGTEPGVADTTPEETANDGVWETSTWALAVSPGFTLPAPPTAPDQPTLAAFGVGSGPSAAAYPGAAPPTRPISGGSTPALAAVASEALAAGDARHVRASILMGHPRGYGGVSPPPGGTGPTSGVGMSLAGSSVSRPRLLDRRGPVEQSSSPQPTTSAFGGWGPGGHGSGRRPAS